jgi:hypothetical protein
MHDATMRIAVVTLLLASIAVAGSARSTAAPSVLFIGNSFTFAEGSPAHFYRAQTVIDLNDEGVGGVPALFKVFTVEAGLDFDVSLETHPGVGLDWHLANKRDVLSRRPWDVVVMHGYSTLDAAKPGDPGKLVATTKQMADLLRASNAKVAIHLMSTWPRADQTYQQNGHWFGKPIDAMTHDVRTAYDQAAAGASVASVIPVGDAWLRSMKSGVADPNPYDGIEAGKVNLWTYDGYHASAYGYYLEALMDFGVVAKRDPRSLGAGECAGYELGMSTAQVRALQDVAYAELSSTGVLPSNPPAPAAPPSRGRCAAAR